MTNATIELVIGICLLFHNVSCQQDCSAFIRCMTRYGALFDTTFVPTVPESLDRFFETICVDLNIDLLLKCYKPTIIEGCYTLQHLLTPYLKANSIKRHINTICSQRKDTILAVECLQKGLVAESLARCTSREVSKQADKNHATLICLRLASFVTCVNPAVRERCSSRAVNILQSSTKEQYGLLCSAQKPNSCVFLLCILFVLCVVFY